MLLALIFFFSFLCYHLAKKRITFLVSHYRVKAKSLPGYYGISMASWNFLASSTIIIILSILEYLGLIINESYKYIALSAIFFIVVVYIFASLKGKYRAQLHFEKTIKWLLKLASAVSILLSLAILITILFEAFKFFNLVPIDQFLLGTKWSPQQEKFGVIPVLTGTLLITFIAMIVALPLGILSAIFLAEYTNSNTRTIIKPIIEILAGVPTIVYGYFAVLVMGPSIRKIGEYFGLSISTESALAAGLVMGIMIIPFVLSLVDDAITAVPQNLKDAALALGSTKAEAVLKIILPAASSGIISAILLATSRAIGETMIVVMAAGINAKLTLNPLDSVTSFTAQIVALLVGDQEFDSAKTLSAFALALSLFTFTLFLNIWAIVTIRRNRHKYE